MLEQFSPAQYLMIDIASSFGLEKKLWGERLDWFQANFTQLEELSRMEIGHALHPLMKAADAPAQFFAGVKAWAATCRGESTGYMIHLDATASGGQLLALLIDCYKSGSNCNLIDTGRRENLYQNIYQEILKILGPSLDVAAADSKRAVMTLI